MTATNRRRFLQSLLASGAAAAIPSMASSASFPRRISPNEKLSVAFVGVGGQGGGDLGVVSSHPAVNVVALCDVDAARAADSFNHFPKAAKYKDYRLMLERQRDIDAVVVSTPDHSHAPAAIMAMKLGRHVYCQKPLAHSVAEARRMMLIARRHRVVTQMGTQGHPSYARTVELIRAGAIGSVSEVHVVTDRPAGWWPQGMTQPPSPASAVPATLDWDLWLGPAAARPFSPVYLPFIWRGWWDFGTGALGDMGWHLMDGPFWAFDLEHPTAVEAVSGPVSRVSPPLASIIHYEFSARGERPALRLSWYDGGNLPDLPGVDKLPDRFNGSIYVGARGKLLSPHGGNPVLLPREQFAGYQAPAPTIPRVENHYFQWVDACRTGSPTGSNFDYAVPLTETVLLGNVALRAGRRIEWDAAHLRVTNAPEAEQYVHYHYRRGWHL